MKRISLMVFLFAVSLASCNKDEFIAGDSAGGAHSAADSAAGGSLGTSSGQANDTTFQAGLLTAGEWSDLEHWPFWLELIAKDSHKNDLADWRFYDFARVSIKLQYTDGSPVIDAPVLLQLQNGDRLWQARTNNEGEVACFPMLHGAATNSEWQIKAEVGGESYSFEQVLAYPDGENVYTIPSAANAPNRADVMFVFDATGSMGDELEYIKVEFEDILNRIQTEHTTVNFRLGATFYRDVGDEYVTRQHALTEHFAEVGQFINAQNAEGGGDYPEAVHEALKEAISGQQWSGSARARLIFLVLDAPPHEEQYVIADLHAELTEAARKGIKIIPVSASGIDKKTEFLLRAMAIATNGTYTFLTDHSGIGDEHLTPTIGEYEVEFLNDLIVRLIGRYVE